MKKICIPCIPKDKNEVFDFFEKVKKFSPDLIEIWFDEIDLDDIEEIVSNKPYPLIWVCKREDEKWTFKWSEKHRIEKIIKICESWSDFIDIWFHTDAECIKEIMQKKWKTKSIISFHNWDKTPKMTTMLWTIGRMLKFEPDYIKYVWSSLSQFDNVKIYRLCENLKKNWVKFVVMAMWEEWKQSRVICPILWSEWAYCPMDLDESSASGQISVEDVRKVWEAISN